MPDSNVLIVDDDLTVRHLLVEYLKAHSYVNVDSARDGVEALHKLTVGSYSVVVLDVMMPKMSGVDLLDSLAAMHADPSLKTPESLPKVVVITAATDGDLPREVVEQKFSGLVSSVFRKPLELTALAEEVERYLRR